MNEWQIILLTGVVSFITALVTLAVTHRNEVKKLVMENRAKLYFDFCDKVEKILNNRFIIYDKEYIDILLTYKSKLKLLSSENTLTAFKDLYEFVMGHYSAYIHYYNSTNPYNNPKYCHIECDAEGVEHEEYNVPDFEISFFENDVEKFKKEHLPSYEDVSKYIMKLYDEMRKDLGNTIW